ncbi:hypothetical protein AGDE_12652 [Angomonas deanei]|uniref:Zeta toxin, putative n=1 Tax=Angomonas deanei TaxID=59799 RepID=A0A7G2C7F2_9TRYP|nr:hypothetical protein AGDE_12652 [Angomonas deanei]CAD2215024.1 Zeta toxin, putative [Angomonas deanei]|eukprot:EPY23898.1 hypothetical protein AGDE_12652 [Angomonas deanei]
MQYPPSSVPFVEYVLKAIEHPPHMFVSKLAACCAMLFLTRSDTELLRTLCYKWAVRFSMDRKKLMSAIRKRSQKSFRRHQSLDVMCSSEENDAFDDEGNETETVEHLMRILNSLILTYFSWNWNKTDYVIQINKEYESLIRENILPLCIVTSAADGLDDPAPSAWLIPRFHSSSTVFSPTSRMHPGEVSSPISINKGEGFESTIATSMPIRIRGSVSGGDYDNSPVTGGSVKFQAPFAPRSATTSKAAMFPKTSIVGSPFLSDSRGGRPSFLSPERITSTPTDDGSVLSLETSTVVSENSIIIMNLANYRAVMEQNTTGILILFHGRFSVKSNEAVDVLQDIVSRRPLNPMPTVAVVYSVTEPELATLYSIKFIPTIVYTPPPECQRSPRLRIATLPGSSRNSIDTNSSSFKIGSGGRGPLSTSIPRGGVGHPAADNNNAFSPTEVLFGVKLKTVSSANNSAAHCTPTSGDPTKDGSDGSVVDTRISDCCSREESSSTILIEEDEFDSTNVELQSTLENDQHITYPMEGVCTFSAIVEWIESRGTKKPQMQKTKNFVARMNAVRAEEKFKRERELHSALVLLRRLQGIPQEPHVAANGAQDGPLFIFLGGGMAAGKTTAAMALAQSAWWKDHKDQSVVVNADEFKLFNTEVDSTRPDVHARSTKAAESLLVQAINQGRSIVYDSTMMWEPYINQVVRMVRRGHQALFKQGRGYLPDVGVEEYFVEAEERRIAMHLPYQIHFLGITVEPEIAVPRGFIRKFTTGRGVPISTQLRSFKYFAQNFSYYASLMDSTTLYDNNVYVDLDKGELPPVMAESNVETGNTLRIRDEAAYQQFMKQVSLNENADNIMEIYGAAPDTKDPMWNVIGSPYSRSASRDTL